MSQHRKVLMIVMDQFRADCIEGALASHVKLPNITALRSEAVTFTNHFSVTNPCGPSRASMFTGKYAMNHRSIRNGAPLSADMTNIALEMRKSGFDPLLFGYTDTSQDPRKMHPEDPSLRTEEQVLPGFREVVEMRMQESLAWRADLKSKGYDVADGMAIFNSISPDPERAARPDDPPIYAAADSDTAFLTNETIKHLSVRNKEKWFALVTFLRPHPPLVAPEPYNTMYNGADLPTPDRAASVDVETAVHPFMQAAVNAPKMENIVRGCDGQVDARNDTDVQLMRALYLGLCTEVDHHIGRLVQFLKDTGQYEDTLIILTADHGELLGDHHMWGKQNPYDQAYRIPLIIRDPKNPAQHGTKVDKFTETIDISPTILDMVGRHVPPSMDGTSLRPFVEGSTPETWRDCVHLELDFGEPTHDTLWQEATGAAMPDANLAILREVRFKLVHFNADLPPLLFDLKTDPHEMNNLADDPAHMATLLRMTRKLLSHRMTHADRTLANVRITENGAIGFTP